MTPEMIAFELIREAVNEWLEDESMSDISAMRRIYRVLLAYDLGTELPGP